MQKNSILTASLCGAREASSMYVSHDWMQIATAPQDGTVVEIRCTYGVAPWYGAYRFVDGRWINFNDPSRIFHPDTSFTWRPLLVSPNEYKDPTGGLQYEMAYWRGAMAYERGLPLDTFESIAAANERQTGGTTVTETERITNAVYDRRMQPRPLHRCHTYGCLNLVAGDDYCARCAEEMSGQPCTFAGVLNEMPKWAHRLFLAAVVAAACFALLILLLLL